MAERNSRKRDASLTPENAKRQQLTPQEDTDSSSDDESDFGQRTPPLIDYIKGILNNYPDGSQILKEIIQNADDAGATEVAFLLDYTTHGRDRLLHRKCSLYQGHALYAWNNAAFKSDDWEGIRNVGISGKASDTLKVGRFGLGFVTVYHITDVPIILSDSSIGILDPQQQIFHNKSGKKFKLKKFFSNSKYSSHHDTFLSYFRYDGSKRYNGTIFRFPLRDSQSNSAIKPDGLYTADSVMDKLFEPLMAEADNVLIFLKSVKSIQLYTKSRLGSEPEIIFSISVPQSYLHDVIKSNRLLSRHVEDRTFHDSILVTINLYPITSSDCVQDRVWLVLNMIGFPQPDSLSGFYTEHKLTYLPWIGIAIETGISRDDLDVSEKVNFRRDWDGSNIQDLIDEFLTECNFSFKIPTDRHLTSDSGKLFCFLPTPEHTDLPVNIHGYFALTNDRRQIKWPSLDSKDTDSNWNKLLVEQLGVSAYVIFYNILVRLFRHEDPEYYQYMMLGGENLKKQSLILVNQGLEILANQNIVYSYVTKSWIRIAEGFYHSSSYTSSQREIQALLEVLGEPLVLLSTNTLAVFSRIKSLKDAIQRNTVSPVLIRRLLRKHSNDTQLIKFFTANITGYTDVILAYIVSRLSLDCDVVVTELAGIPLLQLATHGIVKFSDDSRHKLYLYDDKFNLIRLFPGMEHLFVDTSIPKETYSILLSISRIPNCRINLKDISDIKTDLRLLKLLFQSSIDSRFGNYKPPLNWNPSSNSVFNCEWIKLVWSLIGSDYNLATSLGELPLLPRCQLSSATNQLLPVVSADYILSSTDNRYTSLQTLLTECSAVFVYSHRFIECLDSLVIKPLPGGLLTLLQSNTRVLSEFIDKLTQTSNKQMLNLITDILNENSTFNNSQIKLIKQLPIFPTMSGAHTSLINSCVRLPGKINLPQLHSYPSEYLSPDIYTIDLLYGKLGVCATDINGFVTNNILCFLPGLGASDHFKLSKWLLSTLGKLDTITISKLRNFDWIVDNTSQSIQQPNGYNRPNQLFCSDDDTLSVLLPCNCKYFAHAGYDSYSHLTKEISLFLSSSCLTNQKIFEEVTKSAVQYFYLDIQNVNCSSLWKRRFSTLLKFITNCWQSQKLHMNTLSTTLTTHPIVLPCYTRPDGYPRCLPFLGRKVLTKLHSVVFCNKQDISLIASVRVCVPFSQYTPLLKYLGCETIVTAGMLVEQLNLIVNCDIQSADSEKINSLLNRIYFSKLILDKTNDIKPSFIYVRHKNTFIEARQVVRSSEICLEPFYYSFERLNYSEDTWPLLVKCGAHAYLSNENYHQILHRLYAEQNTESVPKHIELIISIILTLSKSNYLSGVAYLLGADEFLHPAAECLFHDSTGHSERKRVEKRGTTYHIVHARIPRYVASQFGAKSLKITMLGGFWKYKGQYEKLTTRLHSILKEYESKIDVFKELLQNADDAKANTVKLLIDYTSHPNESLIQSAMEVWQGPALYFYNDALFTEEDFENIMKIFGETKLRDTSKIGKFGLGFNTVYHLTDLPSFVSGEYIHMLDPTRKFLVDSGQEPGIQVDLVHNGDCMFSMYEDQFSVFNLELFNCNVFSAEPYNGTLFRLPFRTRPSDITDTVYRESVIEDLLSQILRQAETSILFLQHIKCMEIYKRAEGSDPKLLMKVCKEELTNPFRHHETFNSRYTEHIAQILQHETAKPVVHNQRIRITSENTDGKKERELIVSYSTGTKQCVDFLRNQDNMKDNYTPVSSVALPLSTIRESSHNTPAYNLYCYLPLPVTSPYLMYINGFFALDHSRRGIACTVDGSDRTKWNVALTNDALVNAFINLFLHIKKYFSNQNIPISRFYRLWPLDTQPQSIIWREFPKEFATRLMEENASLFYCESYSGKWIAYEDASFLYYEDCYDHVSLRAFYDFVRGLLLKYEVYLVDISVSLQETHLFRIILENNRDKLYNLKRICCDYVFPNTNSLTYDEVKLVLTSLLPIISTEQIWLKNLFSETPCIPSCTRTLILPSRVVSPHSPLVKLYSASDNRTVHPELEYLFERSSKYLTQLRELGIIEFTLPEEDIIDRCRCQVGFQYQRRIDHCMLILKYINDKQFHVRMNKKLKTQLSEVEFIPVWEDTFLIQIGLQERTRFARPNQCYPYSQRDIVSPGYYAITEEVDKFSCLKTFLSINKPNNSITFQYLINLLEAMKKKKDLFVTTLKFQGELSRRAEVIYRMIFSQWREDNSVPMNSLQDIWHSGINSFCPMSRLFISDKYSHYNSRFLTAFPYKLTTAPDLQKKFLIALGVQKSISYKDVYRILTDIAECYGNGVITPDNEVNLVIDLTNHYFINYVHYRFSNSLDRVLLSSDSRLCTAGTLYINDMPWVGSQDIHRTSRTVVHRSIHPASAYNLGAKSSRSDHFDEQEFEEFGQHEDIADRIKGLKREFPCGTTILKELLQNAEDAGATEVAFVLDNTDYSSKTESLCLSEELHPDWYRYQTFTSLLVYNNSTFSENDLKGIQKVGLGGKKGMQTIGKFGLGFNAVYHLTDSPCLLTRRDSDKNISFCVFDPFRKFLRLKPGSLPGTRFNFDSDKLNRFPDQFSPYSILHSLNANFFPTLTRGDYTIFRLPFTDPDAPRTVEKILSDFLQNSSNLNLFLENVHQISVYRRDTTGSKMLGTFSLSVTPLPPYTPPPSLNCEFLTQIQISKRHITIDKSTVITQTEATSSLGKRSRTGSISSTWLLFTHKGSIRNLEACCPSMKKHLSSYENEKLTHDVYGGVAVDLTPDTTQAAGSCLYSYLPIGDDRPMNFPILINAPFILEPERQHIRFREMEDCYRVPSWEDEWHSAIIQHVIAPLFASLLIYLKSNKMIALPGNVPDYYSWYYTLYPDVISLKKKNQVYSNFIYALCKQLYELLYRSNEQILANQTCTTFYNLCGDNRGIFPDTSISCSPIYPVTSIQFSPKKICHTLQTDSLYSTLNKLNFPLTCAPDHIKSSFKEFSHSLTILSQRILLEYLNSTNFSNYSMSDIEVLLDYLFKANSSVTDSYESIRLKVDYKGGIRHFTKTDITFYSHYADLLPKWHHNFISPLFPKASINILVRHDFIQEMTPDFLSQNLQISEFTNTDCCLFWKFILESQLPSHNLISQFGKFPLIPIIGKPCYSLISNLPAILSQSAAISIVLHTAMMKLQCLQLDLNILTAPSLDVSELTMYLQPLTISNTVTSSQFLSAVKLSDVDIKDVNFTKNEASAILNLLSNIELQEFTSDKSRIISKLKVFSSHQDTLCSIAQHNDCFINTASFIIGPKLHYMLSRDRITIFKNIHKQNAIIKHVSNTCHINMISEKDFFLKHLLGHFTQLDIVEQKAILLFIQYCTKPYKNDFINKLKSVKFIKRGSSLVTVRDCYSPNVELFKVYFPTDLLPVDWSGLLVTYHSIISELGLRDRADLQSVVTAAERIADGSIPTAQDTLIPLSSLVSVIQSVQLTSHEISLLQRLSRIKFLPAWKYVSFSKTCEQKYVSFNEAELPEHRYSCGMATYVHDQLVSNCHTKGHFSVGGYLNIRSKPDAHTVLTHLELICREFNQINSIHKDIVEKLFFHSYKFLQENCDQQILFQRFNSIECILYENKLFYPRNIVFSLDTIILNYLFKAPDALKPYYEFLRLIGVTQSADYSHYSAVMSDLFNDGSLTTESRKKISRTTFLEFISTLRKEEDTGYINLHNLMVLSDRLEIVPLQNVVYIDNTRLKVHVLLFPDLSSQLNFLLDLPPNSLSSCEPPACLKIRHLSGLITETLDPTLRNSAPDVRYQNESNQIEYRLKSREFSRGLIRIYNHITSTNLSVIRIKNDSVKDITKDPRIKHDPLYLTCFQILQKLSVKVVSRLSLQITNVSNGYSVTEDGIYHCFIEDSVLYVNGTNIRQFDFMNDLTFALNLHFGNIFNAMLLQLCLSCENTSDIMGKLDSHIVQPCHFLDDITLPPSPVKPSPVKPSPVKPSPAVPTPTSSRVKPAGVTRSGLLHIIHGPLTPSTETSEDKFIAKLWIQTAQCDLMAAKKLVCGDLPVFTSHACNNCFECAIKVCIAILYYRRYNLTNISYERNLDILLSLVEKQFFSKEIFTNFSSLCVSLMNFGDDSKNPLITPGIGCCIPMEQFSIKTANEAIKNASELLEIVKNEFPTFTELMLSEDGQWIQPATHSLMMAQLESFQINPLLTQQELPLISDEYSAVARNFMDTLPRATIVSILKIHNRQCWDSFVRKVKQILLSEASPEGTPDFKENTLLIKPLFHGSSDTHPDVIIRDSVGFSIEYAREGMWGRGIYFAQNAKYSHGYAHKDNDTGELSMFLSKVFVGNAKFEQHNQDLTGPPPGYHSITGIHPAGTKVYILYENGLAYPGYLIKYRLGQST